MVGRDKQRGVIDRVVILTSSSQSSSLVVTGEPGSGKTNLVNSCVDSADNVRINRTAGVESEQELPYSVLHRLLLPFLDRSSALPILRHNALEAIVNGSPERRPDRLAVGLATLNLLADVAREAPLLCVVDDTQWVDKESVDALAFVARRLSTEAVAVIFCLRENTPTIDWLHELPTLALPPLTDEQAMALASRHAGKNDRRLLRFIADKAERNPLALIELSRSVRRGNNDDVATLEPIPLSGSLGAQILRRAKKLSTQSQKLLLLAAVDSFDPLDPATFWRAAGYLQVIPETVTEEVDRFLTLAPELRFRHPLLRSALYWGYPLGRRRRAHSALARATDPESAPGRRAWHLAATVLNRTSSLPPSSSASPRACWHNTVTPRRPRS